LPGLIVRFPVAAGTNGTSLASFSWFPLRLTADMEVLMKLFLHSLCALVLANGGASLAQAQDAAPAAPPAAQETTELSEADMQKFAEIYVDVETTRAQVTEEMSASEETVAAEEAQGRLQQELVATIERHGWTVDRYNRVANAISNDPAKRDKTVKIINRIVSG
jgi:hypothetical protein